MWFSIIASQTTRIFSLAISILWSTVSKAFFKSRNSTPLISPLSMLTRYWFEEHRSVKDFWSFSMFYKLPATRGASNPGLTEPASVFRFYFMPLRLKCTEDFTLYSI